jgi:subtilisin family serine protease
LLFNPHMLQPAEAVSGVRYARVWMRVFAGIVMAAFWANTAQAQLRLPVVPLPALPVPRLTQTLGQTGADTLQQLSDARRLLTANLIRNNRRTVAADPHGNPVVRGELLAAASSADAIAAAQANGFSIVRKLSSGALDIRLIVLQPPAHTNLVKALRELRAADPGGAYDFNHIYTGVGAVSAGMPGDAPPPQSAEPRASDLPLPRIGLVDSGVDGSHPVFRDALIHRWGCGGRSVPSAHGTAVASLLAGQSPRFHGVLDRAEIYAADVYCNAPTGGAVDALAGAFVWLAEQRVAVINVSLVGPDNAALAQIVRALTSRGYLLVAAVGNDGPAAPPLYPASYPHVIGVTAVDAHRRVLIEAARGNQVMFAARGADMSAADSGGKYAAIRGTSFAAPIVAALLAQSVTAPDLSSADAAIKALAHGAIDLGPQGRDLTYGFGLVAADYSSDLAQPGR